MEHSTISEEDEDIYTEKGRKKLREEDVITAIEEAFMEGYAAAM